MKRIEDLTGRTFGYLTAVELDHSKPRHGYICLCKCGSQKSVSASNLISGHTQSCGCYNKERLTEVHTGHKYNKGRKAYNFKDLSGQRFGSLTVVNRAENVRHFTRWNCKCDCGNETTVYSNNLLSGKTTHCRTCSRRVDITGERIAFLVAESCEHAIKGRPPLWTFRCDCGNTIQGTVRDFHTENLRSCGCHGNVKGSWAFMMGRCYNEKTIRYEYYGGRGITVCKRWHKFENFLADMGECPKRHNLSRKNCEKGYFPENCFWEHVSLNTADTYFGKPTKPGLKKGAKDRR